MKDEGAVLRAAIAADPDALENWLVYADWLSDRNDPRGELINLELAIEGGSAREELVERHRVLVRDELALLSPRLAAQAHHLELELWRGFIRGADVFGPSDDPPDREVLAALYADPHAGLLHRLDIDRVDTMSEAIATLRCESVRVLTLVHGGVRELPLADGFPRLSSLIVHVDEGGAVLERLAHPLLESVSGLVAPLRRGCFDLPCLRALSAEERVIELFEPGAILAEPPPRFESLTVEAEVPQLVIELRTARVTAQLRSLTIGISEEIVDELAVDPAPFRHLEITARAYVDTCAQRDVLVQRLTAMFPSARLEISASDEPRTYAADPRENPTLMANIGDALVRSARRMRR